jgi:hypothetical protein
MGFDKYENVTFLRQNMETRLVIIDAWMHP